MQISTSIPLMRTRRCPTTFVRRCTAYILLIVLVSFAAARLAPAATAQDLKALYNQSLEHYKAGRYGEAEQTAQRGLGLAEKQFGKSHSITAMALNQLAFVYRAQGCTGDSIPLYERALAIKEKALGPTHPEVADIVNNLGNVYEAQGRTGDAIPLYERALAIWEKALGREHPDVATTLNNLANVYGRQGRYGDAIPLYERALAIREKALGPDHPDVAKVRERFNLTRDIHRATKHKQRVGNFLSAVAAWETMDPAQLRAIVEITDASSGQKRQRITVEGAAIAIVIVELFRRDCGLQLAEKELRSAVAAEGFDLTEFQDNGRYKGILEKEREKLLWNKQAIYPYPEKFCLIYGYLLKGLLPELAEKLE